ncbi:MAG: S53 family peptidase [Nevskia sp.]|nr:S53 family peptidase [Nevskia sp.]
MQQRKPQRRYRSASALLAAMMTAAAQAAVPDRIAASPDFRASVPLPGSLRPLLRAGTDSGRLEPETVLHVSLYFGLSGAQQADLDELLRQQQDPLSPNYHAWLTPQQYAARFGLSAADQMRIRDWLKGRGLAIEDVSAGGSRFSVSGSAARFEAAFRTELHYYRVGGERHFASDSELSIPLALSGMLLGVRGLDDLRPKPRLHRAAPQFTSGITGNHFLTPGDFATIYNLTPLYNAGINGSGHKIAVVGQTQINLSDIRAFRAAAGLPAQDPVQILLPNSGTPSLKNGSDDMAESDIDIEWTGGLAPQATIEFVYAGSSKDVFDALSYAIEQNLAPVISTSYGNCESANPSLLGSGIFQQANTQGQTVLASSGDAGAADCDTAGSATATNGIAVDFPASSPNVTGVGGTEFNESGTGYWASNGSQDVISSALSYMPEVAWNDTGKTVGTGSSASTQGLSASGGGRSAHFTTKPTWQAGVGVSGDNTRDVPDVSLSASPLHDPYLFCTTDSSGHGTCVNGFRNNDAQTTLTAAGGTSFSAPAFAAILSLVNQKAGPAGGLGNANPMLYQLAATTTGVFHDITSGNNNVPTSSGTVIGYSAGVGYDPVTGLGSVDASALANAWALASASGSSSGGSSSSSSSSGASSSGGTGSSSSSSGGSSSSGSTASGGGGGGGGAWPPLALLVLGALLGLRRHRQGIIGSDDARGSAA